MPKSCVDCKCSAEAIEVFQDEDETDALLANIDLNSGTLSESCDSSIPDPLSQPANLSTFAPAYPISLSNDCFDGPILPRSLDKPNFGPPLPPPLFNSPAGNSSPTDKLPDTPDFIRHFPYARPYPQQIALMSAIYNTLEAKQSGLFESPTGTGKTACLLTACLTWLLDHNRRQAIQLAQLEAQLHEFSSISNPLSSAAITPKTTRENAPTDPLRFMEASAIYSQNKNVAHHTKNQKALTSTSQDIDIATKPGGLYGTSGDKKCRKDKIIIDKFYTSAPYICVTAPNLVNNVFTTSTTNCSTLNDGYHTNTNSTPFISKDSITEGKNGDSLFGSRDVRASTDDDWISAFESLRQRKMQLKPLIEAMTFRKTALGEATAVKVAGTTELELAAVRRLLTAAASAATTSTITEAISGDPLSGRNVQLTKLHEPARIAELEAAFNQLFSVYDETALRILPVIPTPRADVARLDQSCTGVGKEEDFLLAGSNEGDILPRCYEEELEKESAAAERRLLSYAFGLDKKGIISYSVRDDSALGRESDTLPWVSPQIIYCSRTHTQLLQVAAELRKSPELASQVKQLSA